MARFHAVLFSSKKKKLNKQKNEEIEAVKQNIEKVKEADAQINQILTETTAVRNGLNSAFLQCLNLFGRDYTSFSDEQKKSLGALVNDTKALYALFQKTI